MSPARLRSFWASCVRHMDCWFLHIALCKRIAKTSLNLSVSLWTLSFPSLLTCRRNLLRWSSTQAWSQANTSIRWLLLQPTTNDPKLEAVCRISARMREEVLLGLLVFQESYHRLGGGHTVICRCFFSRTMQFLSYCFMILGWGNDNATMSIVWACHCGIAVSGVFFLGLKSCFFKYPTSLSHICTPKVRLGTLVDTALLLGVEHLNWVVSGSSFSWTRDKWDSETIQMFF